MDQHDQERPDLDWLRQLNESLIAIGAPSHLREDPPAVVLRTQRPEMPLFIFVSDGEFFSWQHPEVRHPVSDVSGAAATFSAQAQATDDAE